MGIFTKKIDVQRAFDTVADGVDNIFYTNEEKISDLKDLTEQQVKIADKATEFYGKTLDENTVRSKSRRFVALSVVFTMLLVILTYVIAGFFTKNLNHLEKVIFDSVLSTSFLMIQAFFFGGYYLNKKIDFSGLVDKLKRKKKDKEED